MKAIRPLYDKIVVRRLEELERSKGGIIIPDNAKEKPMEGVVLAVGEGRLFEDGKLYPLHVKVGDHVLFGKYSGTEIKVAGDGQLVIREDDVLGIVTEVETPADVLGVRPQHAHL
jgi:chaperonin GroES